MGSPAQNEHPESLASKGTDSNETSGPDRCYGFFHPKMGIYAFCRKLKGTHVVEPHDVVGVLVSGTGSHPDD